MTARDRTMSSLMKDWIGPVVEGQLGRSLQELQEGTFDQTCLIGPSSNHVNDLTIKLKGKHVQVISLDGETEEHFDATVSDGSTYMLAAFNQSAVKLYEREQGRTFSSLKRGVINLIESNLLNGTQQQRLVLRVSKFKVLGSEGSPIFGHPKHILDRQTLPVILEGLDQIYTRIRTLGPTLPSLDPSRRINHLEGGSPLSGAHFTQGFATQVQISPKHKMLPTVLVSKSKSWQDFPDGAIVKNPPRNDFHRPSQSDKKDSKHLLGLLGRPEHAKLKSVPMAVPGERVLEMTSRLEVGRNELRVISPEPFRSSNNSAANKLTSASRPCQTETFMFSPNDSGKENSQESATSRKRLVCALPENQPENGLIEQPNVSPLFFDQFLCIDREPFGTLKRVPRKYVRIPVAQQPLLDREDSWFKSQGDVHSAANIPAAVKEHLRAFVDQSISQRVISYQNQNSDTEKDQSEDESVNYNGSTHDACGQSLEDKTGDDIDFIDNLEDAEMGVMSSKHSESATEDQDDRCTSWSPSPELHLDPGHLFLKGDRQLIPSSDASNHQNAYTNQLEDVKDVMGYTRLADPLSRDHVHSLAPHSMGQLSVNIPSSSPVEEEELDLVIPHAVGDALDEEVNVYSWNLPHLLPSTAPPHLKIVEVEQTPHLKSSVSDGSSPDRHQSVKLAKGTNRALEDVSSDLIIPATFKDMSYEPTSGLRTGSRSLGTTSLQELMSQSTHHLQRWAMDFVGSYQTDLAEVKEHQVWDKHENFQIKDTDSVGTPKPAKDLYLKEDPTIMTPMAVTSFDTSEELSLSPLSPHNLGTDHSHPYIEDMNIPRKSQTLKRGIETITGTPQQITIKRQRRMPRGRLSERESYQLKDTKEMARIGRHLFKKSLSVAAAGGKVQQLPKSLAISPNKSHRLSRTNDETVYSAPEISLSNVQSELHFSKKNMPTAPELCTSPGRHLGSRDNTGLISTTGVVRHVTPSATSKDLTQVTGDGIPNGEVFQVQTTRNKKPVAPRNFFDIFKEKYPDFPGSKNNFVWALVYIECLRERKQLLHRSLCDDFVRVMGSDYLEYIRGNLPSGESLITGWEFYDENISAPVYKQELITPENLAAALSTFDTNDVEGFRTEFKKPSDNSTFSGVTRGISRDSFGSEGNQSPESRTQSQELRSRDYITRELSRKPFFKPLSQISIPKLKMDLKVRQPSSPTKASRTKHKCGSKRSLPWSRSDTSDYWNTKSPLSEAAPPASETITRKPRDCHPIHRSSSTLGSQTQITMSGKISNPMTHNGSDKLIQSRHNDDIFAKSLSTTTSKVSLLEKVSLNEGVDDLQKVEGWLDEQLAPKLSKPKPPRSFAAILKHRRESGGFPSKTTTPMSTLSKRRCIKSKNL